MKKLDTTHSGGAPLKQKALAFLQTGHLETLRALVEHLGISNVGNFIISGCEVVGTNITAGMMYIDGDLCPFVETSGTLDTKISKITNIENVSYKNGNSHPFYESTVAAVNSNGIALSDFERLPKVQELVNEIIDWSDIAGIPQVVIDPFSPTAVPAELTVLQRLELLEKKNAVFTAGGGMVLWNKPAIEIPGGWYEVADWKGRIPVGVDDRLNLIGQLENPEFATLVSGQLVPGRTGGKKTHKLTQAELPNYNLTRDVDKETPTGGNETIWSSAPGTFATQTINSGGGDQPHPILNPYRTVLFIEYTGVSN